MACSTTNHLFWGIFISGNPHLHYLSYQSNILYLSPLLGVSTTMRATGIYARSEVEFLRLGLQSDPILMKPVIHLVVSGSDHISQQKPGEMPLIQPSWGVTT